MIGRFVAHVRGLLGRRRAQQELEEELQFHLAMETRANIERGIRPDAAARRARIDLGGLEQTRLAATDVRHTPLDSVAQDLRHGARRFNRQRGTGLAAVVTLALTVGLATAVYSVAHSVLLQPFPYEHADRLLSVWKATPEVDFFPLPIPEVLDLRERSRTLEGIGGFTRDGFMLQASVGARWVEAFIVTPNLFEVVGLRATRGRTFLPEDAEPGREKVAIIGERLWREAFAAAPDIIGRMVPLRDEGAKSDVPDLYRIVGVVPSDLEIFYPKRFRAQMYFPWVLTAEDRSEEARRYPSMFTIARLRPGVPARDGIAEMSRLMAESASGHPATSIPNARPRVVPLHEELVGRTRPAFVLLAAAAGLLLLIGCANVSNLLLASGLGRRQEFSARLALGCSRRRLFRQLVTEQVIPAGLGGALGVALATWATPMLRRLAPASLPRAADIRLDGAALLIALGVSLLAWLASAVAPSAILAWSASPVPDGTGRTMTRRGRWLRSSLVVAQTTLVLALLAGAALLTNGMWRLTSVDLGFSAEDVFVAQVVVPRAWWRTASPKTTRLEQELVHRLSADRRFQHVTMGSDLPFSWGVLTPVRREKHDKPTWAMVAAVGPHYPTLLGMRLRQGRHLTWREEGSRNVVVVNQTLARHLFQGAALGQRLFIDGNWRQVVGLVEDVTEIGELRGGIIRREGLGRLTLPAAYLPIGSTDCFNHFLLCRTSLDAASAAHEVQKQLQALEPDAAIRRSGWLGDAVNDAGADVRFCAFVIGLFAVAALLLGGIGVYAVLAHTVRERTLEIGIRTALGGAPGRVGWTMARAVVLAVALGCALGLGTVLATGRLLEAFLFEVTPADPWTLSAATVFLLLVALAAGLLPARAALAVDPARALRSQ